MRFLLLVALFFTSSYSGFISDKQIAKYDDLSNAIIYNEKNNLELFKSLSKDYLVRPKINDKPLLYLAAKYRKDEIFKELISKKLNPNVIFNDTTLIHYILSSRILFLKYLDLNEINFLTPNGDNDIPINFLTQRYNFKLLKPFLDKLSNDDSVLEVKNNKGKSFIHLLIDFDNIEALTILSQKYKLKSSHEEFLDYAIANNFKALKPLLHMLPNEKPLFIKNKNNVISKLLNKYHNNTNATENNNIQKSLKDIFNYLKKINKLEFLISFDENGSTFIHQSIINNNSAFIDGFYQEGLSLPINKDVLLLAIENNFVNENLFKLVKQYDENSNILHNALKKEDLSANINNFTSFFDFPKFNNLDTVNKEHFLTTAIKNKRWDFVYNVLLNHSDHVEFSDNNVLSLIDGNIELSEKLILNKNSNDSLFSETFLFYLINSNKIANTKKEEIINFFIQTHVVSKRDLDLYFFTKGKRDITIFKLLELKLPTSSILDKLSSFKNKVEEEPFNSIYVNKKLPAFYNDNLLKLNVFGHNAISVAVNDNYSYLLDLLKSFSQYANSAEIHDLFEFTKDRAPHILDTVVSTISLPNYSKDVGLVKNRHTTTEFKKSYLFSILNEEKLVLKENAIDFEQILVPMYLYNQNFFNNVPKNILYRNTDKLVKLFIKYNDVARLKNLIEDTGYSLKNQKLGSFAVSNNFSDLQYLIKKGIDLDFKFNNSHSYFDTLILERDINKLGELLKTSKHNLLSNNSTFEPAHILDLIFPFDNLEVLFNLKRNDYSNYSKMFFKAKYIWFIDNNKLEPFKLYVNNGLFDNNINIYKKLISSEDDTSEFFKIIYSNKIDTNTKKEIVSLILLHDKPQLLSFIDSKDVSIALSDPNLLLKLFDVIDYSALEKTFNLLLDNNVPIHTDVIKFLYDRELYAIVKNIYSKISYDNFNLIRKDLLPYLSSIEENFENMELFKLVFNKYYSDFKIPKELILKSVNHRGRFNFLINKSELNLEDYQDIFGSLLSINPKHTMYKKLLEHPIGSKISFNKVYNGKHLLEIMIDKGLEEMFSLTIDRIIDKLEQEAVENIQLSILLNEDLILYNKHIDSFNKLNNKYKINPVELFLREKFNFAFIAFAIKNSNNINLVKNNQHPIFSLFENNEASNIEKIKLFYAYKDKQLNILQVDNKKRSILHYLADLDIKPNNLQNLLSMIPEDIRIRFIESSGLFNHLLEKDPKYNDIIFRAISSGKPIDLTKTEVPFALKAIELKNKKVVDFLIDANYVVPDIKDSNNISALQYSIKTNDLYFVEKLISIGADVNDVDVEYAIISGASFDIVEYLKDKNTIIYKIVKFINLIVNNMIYLSLTIFIFALIVLTAILSRVKKIKQINKLKELEKNKLDNMSAEDLKLLELKEKVSNLAISSEGEELDEETVRKIEEEFDKLNEDKNPNIYSIQKDDVLENNMKQKFSQEDLKVKLNKINNDLKDFDIDEKLLKALENDFKDENEENEDEDTGHDK